MNAAGSNAITRRLAVMNLVLRSIKADPTT